MTYPPGPPQDDALTLVQWAQRMRLGVLILEMVLDGELCPVVEDGEVKLGLPQEDYGRRDVWKR